VLAVFASGVAAAAGLAFATGRKPDGHQCLHLLD
jgi:hypothetical protein